MKQCQELLETEASGEIYIHCLGSAIKRGITLALKLVQESDNGLGYEANTSTIDLVGMACDILAHVFADIDEISHGHSQWRLIIRIS